jgi:hypothetical protein
MVVIDASLPLHRLTSHYPRSLSLLPLVSTFHVPVPLFFIIFEISFRLSHFHYLLLLTVRASTSQWGATLSLFSPFCSCLGPSTICHDAIISSTRRQGFSTKGMARQGDGRQSGVTRRSLSLSLCLSSRLSPVIKSRSRTVSPAQVTSFDFVYFSALLM